jgi:hypothetical protein
MYRYRPEQFASCQNQIQFVAGPLAASWKPFVRKEKGGMILR